MPAFWEYPPPHPPHPPHPLPPPPMITQNIGSYWIQSQNMTKPKLQIQRICQIFIFFNKLYTRHTSWSCLIRCVNMEWIRQVLLKIQSRHDSVHRRTVGQSETSIPPFRLCWSGGYNDDQAKFTDIHVSAGLKGLIDVQKLSGVQDIGK